MPTVLLKSRRFAIAGIAVISTIGLTLWRILAPSQAANPPAAQVVPVSVAAVEQRDVPQRVSGIGTVQSLHSVTLRPQVSGVVTDVLFREGQLVEQGALLARIDDRSIRAALMQAQAEKARNEAQLKSAELDLVRYGNLLAEEAISRQTLEQQSAQVEQLKAAIRANDATIAAQQVQLSYTQITAPVTGRVGIRRVDPGNLVQAGDSTGLVSVTQIDPISVVFTLSQELLPRIQPLLQHARIAQVTAYDRDAGALLAQGRLVMIDNQIDAASGTIRLRAEFENADEKLWPGQFVTVQLQTSVSVNATVVPARTVQQGLQGAFVFRVRDTKAEVVPVGVAYQDDDIAVIGDGLAPGETVVIDGQSRLKPGSIVKPVAGASAATVAAVNRSVE